MKRIYLDYNATTPVHPQVAAVMEKYTKKHFGNPSSSHWFGIKAKEGVEKARMQAASLLGCLPEEIVFTSGGTESNNFAIRGVAETFGNKGNHIIATAIEHPAVIEPCKYLEKRGYEITYLPVDEYGMVDPSEVKKAIRPSTILLTVMHANNEVGTIQPIEEISNLARKNRILFHTDAAQSVGKIPTRVYEMGVDFLSIAGHKLYAPKGVGALYIKKTIGIQPFMLGAGHESGRRAGTENVIGIAGLGKACEILERKIEYISKSVKELSNMLYEGLRGSGIRIKLNGHPEARLPNTLNISFTGIDSHDLLGRLKDISASTGSACHADRKKPSGVLTAMGIKPEDAHSAVRFSLGLWTTKQEVEYVIGRIKAVILK